MSPADTARIAYTDHVVRRACCTGGRLCPTGRVLAAEALVEERRRYYGALSAMWQHHNCAPPCVLAGPMGLEMDEASISLDIASAAASDERIRASVAWA